jgi:hypothetical protein
MANVNYGINGYAFDNVPGAENMHGYRFPPGVRNIIGNLIRIERDGELGRGIDAAGEQEIQNSIIMLQNEVGNMSAADRRKIVRAIGFLQGSRDDDRLPPPGFIDVLERARLAIQPGNNNNVNMQLNGGRKRTHRKTKRSRRSHRRKHTSRRR